jgi:hypothetical protein
MNDDNGLNQNLNRDQHQHMEAELIQDLANNNEQQY